MRRLADRRRLDARDVRAASAAARALLREWYYAGWLHAEVRQPPRG
jgi:50S ribosomal protein L16 3-hydroxylase